MPPKRRPTRQQKAVPPPASPEVISTNETQQPQPVTFHQFQQLADQLTLTLNDHIDKLDSQLSTHRAVAAPFASLRSPIVRTLS